MAEYESHMKLLTETAGFVAQVTGSSGEEHAKQAQELKAATAKVSPAPGPALCMLLGCLPPLASPVACK